MEHNEEMMEKPQKTIGDIVEEICLRHEQNEKWGTAALYRSVLHAICDCCQLEMVPFEVVTPSWLKSFEGYLRAKGLTWNSVSTYMRILRAVYHEAVMAEIAPFKPYIFNKVSADSVLIVTGLSKARDVWHEIVTDERAVLTFDLYYCGIVLFDKKRNKKNYIVNF